jgi:hypothetical protein
LLSLLGLGGAAAGSFFQKLRYPLIAVSIVFLAFSFYSAYRRHPSRRNKIIAWSATVFTAIALAYTLLS